MPNILRSKDNQTMKLDQLIECNIRNIFLEKSYTKCGGEASPIPFSGKSKFSISLDQWPKVLYCLFSLNPKLMTIKIYWNLAADRYVKSVCNRSYSGPHFPAFGLAPRIQSEAYLKNRKRSGTSLSVSFSA